MESKGGWYQIFSGPYALNTIPCQEKGQVMDENATKPAKPDIF